MGILQLMSPCAIVTVVHRDLGTQEALLTESRLSRTELVSWETVEEGTGGQVRFQALCLKQVSLLPNSAAFACPVTPGCIPH